MFLTPVLLLLAAPRPFPDAVVDVPPASAGKQTAVLAGGCFWSIDAVFARVKGVERVIAGYAGGDAKTAHYQIVGLGGTNHAESVEVTFNPAAITYGQLLRVFFSVAHNPTTLNRQGPDWGKEYRSAIFYVNEEQKRVAEAYIRQLDEARVFSKPIVTEVTPLQKFYPAEDYHQDYVKLHPTEPYILVNSLPKIDKLKKLYPLWVKPW